jgi:HEAT repeat protein
LGLRIPVIPILLKRTSVHLRLETVQRWDFTNPAVRPIDKLIDQLKQIQSAKSPQAETENGILPALDDLYSEDRELRLAAVTRLGECPNPLSVPHLLGVLGDDDRDIRLAIVRALGKIADIRALPRLLYIVRHHPDSQLRTAAVEALGQIDDARVIPGLIAALSDKNETVHHVARQALVNKGDDALNRLADELHNPNWKIRQVAAQTLGEIGGTASLNQLIAIINDADIDVRIEVIRALGAVGDPAAVPYLVRALHDENNGRWRVTAMILLSLKTIGTPEALSVIEAWHQQQKKPQVY